MLFSIGEEVSIMRLNASGVITMVYAKRALDENRKIKSNALFYIMGMGEICIF